MSHDLKELRRQIALISGTVNKLSGEERETLLFREFASSYLSDKLINPTLRKATKVSIEIQVRVHLIPAFGNLPLSKISNTIWLQWVSDKQAESSGHRTRLSRFFNARKVLIEIMGQAVDAGHLDKSPSFDNPDSVRNVGRALDDKEVLALVWRSRRPFRLIFYALYKTGIRPRELLSWEFSMFEWDEPGHTWLNVPARISKTDRTRRIPINPKLSKLLYARYVRMRHLSAFVFPARWDVRRPQAGYQVAWKRACKETGVSAMVYDLRRTFITRCAAEGKPLIYIAKLLDTSVALIESVYAKNKADILEDIVK